MSRKSLRAKDFGVEARDDRQSGLAETTGVPWMGNCARSTRKEVTECSMPPTS